MTEYEKEVLDSIQRKLARVEARLDQCFRAFDVLYKQGKSIMAVLDDILAKVVAQGSQLDAIGAEVGTLVSQANGSTLPPALAATAQTISDDLAANATKLGAIKAALDAAIAPPPPPPAPPPPGP